MKGFIQSSKSASSFHTVPCRIPRYGKFFIPYRAVYRGTAKFLYRAVPHTVPWYTVHTVPCYTAVYRACRAVLYRGILWSYRKIFLYKKVCAHKIIVCRKKSCVHIKNKCFVMCTHFFVYANPLVCSIHVYTSRYAAVYRGI